MYESQPSGSHLTKADMATFCAEATFALAVSFCDTLRTLLAEVMMIRRP